MSSRRLNMRNYWFTRLLVYTRGLIGRVKFKNSFVFAALPLEPELIIFSKGVFHRLVLGNFSW